MANLVLTRTCNRACSFCFAPNDASPPLPLSELVSLAERLRAEGRDFVPLVGGEPSLHPSFIEVVDTVLGLGMKLRIFTSGVVAERHLRRLEAVPPDRCLVIVNMNATWADPALELRVDALLQRLGRRACLGVTLADLRIPPEAVADRYARHPLAGIFRLGIAQPSLDRESCAMDYRMPGLGAHVTKLVELLAELGVKTDFDCGFVMCTFTPDERERLERAGAPLRSVCGPIPDVAGGGEAWPCYPLAARYRRPLGDASLSTLRRQFERDLRGFRAAGLYPECRTCRFFADGSCHGGCLARVIPTFSVLGANA